MEVVAGLWRLELLGWLRASSGDSVITRFPTRQTGSLFAYLALNQQRSHPREELAELLWPNNDPGATKDRLNQAVASLRRQIEPPGIPRNSVLMSNYQTVRLAPGVVVTDVEKFEELARAFDLSSARTNLSELTEALALYRGELLPGFYDDWIRPERQRLSDLYADLLEKAYILSEESGDLTMTVDVLTKLVALNPLEEKHHQNLMMLYCRRGQVTQALAQFEELRRVCEQEFRSEPSPLSLSLAKKIRSGEFQKLAMPSPAKRKSTPAKKEPPVTVPALPLQQTRFVGRTEELEIAQSLLAELGCRLVNLMGAGGCGKSRMALEVARSVVGAFSQTWFVPLGDVLGSDQIPEVLRRSMGAEGSEGGPVFEDVIRRLRMSGRSLLILDNFEKFTERGTPYIRRLLDEAPNLSILVTSRHRLGLYEERNIQVDPLPLPLDRGDLIGVAKTPSVQLFIDRAQAVRPDFQLTTRNLDVVVSLCERLEGIPLAIELAAAWISTLSPSQLLEGMQSRFDLLVSRRRDISPRHRSLRAAIEYGYELLPPASQEFFRRLSVFRSGWTLAAAQTLGGTSDVRQALDELTERSLLKRIELPTANDVRYDMLETLREYGREQLSGEEESEAMEKIAHYFLEFLELGGKQEERHQKAIWIEKVAADHQNIVATLHWCYENDQVNWGLRIACALETYWDARGPFSEAPEWIQRFLGIREGELSKALEANALRVLGWSLWHLADFGAAETYFTASLALYEGLGMKREIAQVLYHLGTVGVMLWDKGRARDALSKSLSLFEELQDKSGAAVAMVNLGLIARQVEDYDEAQKQYRGAIRIFRELGDETLLASCYGNLSIAVRHQGEVNLGLQYATKSLELGAKIGNRRILAAELDNIALCLMVQGKYQDALGHSLQGLNLAWEIGHRMFLLWHLETATYLAWKFDDARVAARISGFVDKLGREVHAPPDNPAMFEATKELVRAALKSDSDYEVARALGEMMSDEEAYEFVRSWGNRRLSGESISENFKP